MAKSYKYNRSRKPLTMDEAKLRMTDAVHAMEKIILSSSDEHKQIQAVNALSGLLAKYAKIIETTEIIERIEQLENRQLKKVG